MPRSSHPLPLYIQIADRIRRKIASGEIPAQSKLPTQRDLAEKYKTTLMTVRQALEVLEDENLIRSEHGVGTFVIGTGVQEDNIRILSFSNEMKQRSRSIETRLLSKEKLVINAAACRALDLPEGTPLGRIDRLRLYNGLPIVLQHSYLPPELSSVIDTYTPQSALYEQIRNAAGEVVAMTREILRPITPSLEQASLLDCPPESSALLSMRISLNHNDRPLVYDEALLHGGRFLITTERIGHRTSYRYNLIVEDNTDLISLLKEIE